MARLLTADCDCAINEDYTEGLDDWLGGDEQFVGANFGYLVAVSTDDREVVEKELMAADLLRQAMATASWQSVADSTSTVR